MHETPPSPDKLTAIKAFEIVAKRARGEGGRLITPAGSLALIESLHECGDERLASMKLRLVKSGDWQDLHFGVLPDGYGQLVATEGTTYNKIWGVYADITRARKDKPFTLLRLFIDDTTQWRRNSSPEGLYIARPQQDSDELISFSTAAAGPKLAVEINPPEMHEHILAQELIPAVLRGQAKNPRP